MRRLSLLDVTCLGVNAIVGAGIFALPDDLARHMGGASPLAFLLCGVALVPVALCFSAMARRTDRSGAAYAYAREALGPAAGFAVGWTCFGNAVLALAAVAAFAAAYAGRLWPALATPAAARGAAAALIVAFGALNAAGIKPSARAVNLLTACKVAVLLVLVGVAAARLEPSRLLSPPASGALSPAGVGAAAFLALFACQGFEVAPVPAGETADPRRTVPRATVLSLAVAVALYVAVQAVLVMAWPALAAESDTPLADAALAVAPSIGGLVVAGGLVSTVGFVAGAALGTPRYVCAMAEDGALPRALAAAHPRRGTPYLAIAATTALAAGLALACDARSLVGMSNVTVAVQYLATCLAAQAIARRAGADAPRLPWIVPVAGVATSAWVFSEGRPAELAFAGGALAIGAAVAFGSRLLARRASSG